MKRSRAAKVLAVYQVCKVNTGRHTAGVDGIAIPIETERRPSMMMKLLGDINVTRKPQPIRRVYIPKPVANPDSIGDGSKQPLGIPTLSDRISQEIIRQAIEPICEHHFQNCSYGFRPLRGCQDASDLFNKLSKAKSRRWIVEGDIKGCFDHIRHDHIISTLSQWHIPRQITGIIQTILKTDVMEETRTIASVEGTPQGGVISPMLANVALTCLNEEIQKRYGMIRREKGNPKVSPIVRYADDFVVVANSKEQAEAIKSHITGFLKAQTGLTLSDEKTQISEISKGFDFLGFNFRKYGEKDKLLIQPSKGNIRKVRGKLKETFRKYSDGKPDRLIRKLNQIINGWGNYYRHVVSKDTYNLLDTYTWIRTQRWINRRHPTKRWSYWYHKYFMTVKDNRWIFCDKQTGAKLNKMANIPIIRFIKVHKDRRVYDVKAREYWEEREYKKAKNIIIGTPVLTKMFYKQKGRCAYCGHPITQQHVRDTTIHKHHLTPRSEGGDWKLRNLRLLHAECHNSIHGMYSRKEMASLISKGIDYLRLMKSAMT
jgi:RNA-directed DNA polymerase